MTDEQLADIRARHAAASEGPYTPDIEWNDTPEGGIDAAGGGLVCVVAPFANVNTIARHGGRTFSHDDARFLAGSWADVRDLLAEVRRLRAALADATAVARLPYPRRLERCGRAVLSPADVAGLGDRPSAWGVPAAVTREG